MKTLFLILSTLIASEIHAQSLSVSPTSFIAWGRGGNTALIEGEYKNVSAVYLYVFKPDVDYEGNEYDGGFAGLFYSPINIGDKLYSKGSIGIFHRKYPTDLGQRIHFRLQVGYTFNRISVEYSHISNGFGLAGNFNTGVDNLSLRVNF